jgi:hypothetical protein
MASCLVAACAICALAATNASAALPEWGKCVKLPVEVKGKVKIKGKYANANCTEKTGGEYEFLKGTEELPSKEFTNTMTSPEAVLEADGIEVHCTAETATGDLAGTKEVAGVRVVFKGCVSNFDGLTCENQFESEDSKYVYTEGQIVTRLLRGKLGYISGKGTASPVVGLALEPEEKKGAFAFFGCGSPGGAPVIFSTVGETPTGKNGGDTIISPISPVNKMATETVQVYSDKTKENPETHEIEIEHSIQEPTSFENGKPDYLETNIYSGFASLGWRQSSQVETAVTKLDSGEEIEIKA